MCHSLYRVCHHCLCMKVREDASLILSFSPFNVSFSYCCSSVAQSCPTLCNPWIAARPAYLSLTVSQSLFKLMSIESVMPSNHLVIPFSSWILSFPVSGYFPVSQLFITGGQITEASATILPMNIQDWFPLGLTGLILQSKGLSRIFANTTVRKHQFFSFSYDDRHNFIPGHIRCQRILHSFWNIMTHTYRDIRFSSVQSHSRVRLFATPWIAAYQAFLSITNSQILSKLMSIESVMPSNHLILCHPILLLPSIFPNIRVFSNESVLHIRWPTYWSFSFSISPSNEYSELISFRVTGLIYS